MGRLEDSENEFLCMDKKALYIMSAEAKDLYGAQQIRGNQKQGYCVRNKNGELRLNKFTNALDYSLDTIKLQEVYEKVTRRRNFCEKVGNKQYTQAVINVEFNYSYKEFNKVGKNTYLRAGYVLQDCKVSDGVYVEDGELVVIQTNVEVLNPISKDILGKYFSYIDGCYVQTGNIPVLKNKAELRRYFYENGVYVDGALYCRWKRSAGSSRTGKCLFILYSLFDRITKWDRCGINIFEGDSISLAEFESYVSLTQSSIINTIDILPEEILLIKDRHSEFEEEIIAVESKNNELFSSQKVGVIKNSLFDGESLLDTSLFGQYPDKGMLVLRAPFYKTCAFNCNIQEFFQDNGITRVDQLNGETLAEDISQIKLITSESSLKYLKFGDFYKWLTNISGTFGVVKHEKPTKFFDSRLVSTHYQLLNSLNFTYSGMEDFLKPSLDYLGLVRSDVDVLRHHINYSIRAADEPLRITPTEIKNDIVFQLLGINNDFACTKMYKNFRKSTIRSMKRTLNKGHVLVRGNYSTLFGNGIEMLKESIGIFDGESSMKKGSVYCKNFADGEKVLISRSPHITMGNLMLSDNVHNREIDKYFNLSKEIICVNAIRENIQQRLSGCDYDSDTALISNDATLIALAKKHYDKFLVPTSVIELKKIPRKYTARDLATLDTLASSQKIGEIVNKSQMLNSLLWHRVNNGESVADCNDLYLEISKLSILSSLEIDRCKKEVQISTKRELDKLTSKYKITKDGKVVNPSFFKTISEENGYEINDRALYEPFDTAMDYLQDVVAKEDLKQSRSNRSKTIPFMDIIKKPTYEGHSGYNVIQRDKLIGLIREKRIETQRLYLDFKNLSKEEKYQVSIRRAEIIQECVDAVRRLSSCEYMMYITLKEIEKKENSDIANLMFNILFQNQVDVFYTMVQRSVEPIPVLIESNDGDIKLYDFLYKKAINP